MWTKTTAQRPSETLGEGDLGVVPNELQRDRFWRELDPTSIQSNYQAVHMWLLPVVTYVQSKIVSSDAHNICFFLFLLFLLFSPCFFHKKFIINLKNRQIYFASVVLIFSIKSQKTSFTVYCTRPSFQSTFTWHYYILSDLFPAVSRPWVLSLFLFSLSSFNQLQQMFAPPWAWFCQKPLLIKKEFFLPALAK